MNEINVIIESGPSERKGMGWHRDLPDMRDFTLDNVNVAPILARTKAARGTSSSSSKTGSGVGTAPAPTLLPTMDLRPWCSPIENQGSLGSCTANAGVGLVEYFERRAFGKHIDGSRLFTYKVTRNLLHWIGDTGAYLRSTMKALALFGVPPEEYLPYNIATFDLEPSAFVYSFAQSFQSIKYYRLDPSGTTKPALLNLIKTNIAAGLPSMFGFTVYSSYTQAAASGKIPYPTVSDSVAGGHAVDAVGYDDTMKIKNTNLGGIETTGALLIRNSWGTAWGAGGYGWLPYEYVLKGLAVDWWSIITNEWIDTGQFS